MFRAFGWIFFGVLGIGCTDSLDSEALEATRVLGQGTHLMVEGVAVYDGETRVVDLSSTGPTEVLLTVVSTQFPRQTERSSFSMTVWGADRDQFVISAPVSGPSALNTNTTFTLSVTPDDVWRGDIEAGVTLAWGTTAQERISVTLRGTFQEPTHRRDEVVVAVGMMGSILVSEDFGESWFESMGWMGGGSPLYVRHEEESNVTLTSPITRPDTLATLWTSVIHTGSRFMIFGEEENTGRFRSWASVDGFQWEILDTLDARTMSPRAGVRLDTGVEILQAVNAVYVVPPHSDSLQPVSVEGQVRWAGLAAMGNTAVMLSKWGEFYRTENGQHWESSDTEFDVASVDVAAGNGRFVAVGRGGQVLVSYDGEQWSETRAPDVVEEEQQSCSRTVDWCAVQFNGTYFVTYTVDEAAGYWVRWTSTDGVVWASEEVQGTFEIWESFSEEDTTLSVLESRNIGMSWGGSTFTRVLERSNVYPRLMDIAVGTAPEHSM